jgi:hypothetical protein
MLRSTTTFAMGAIVALVLGTGTAYAATGGKFILGRSNSASTTTTLSNAYGTALTLNSKVGHAPFKVNRTTKVTYLNSDLLDGLDSTHFARATTVGSIYGTGFVSPGEDEVDPADDVVVAVAVCPAGSQVVGGGGSDFTTDGYMLYSAPDGTDAWVVMSDATVNEDNAAAVEAYARCWNPRGNVASNMRVAPVPHELSAQAEKAMRKAAARN